MKALSSQIRSMQPLLYVAVALAVFCLGTSAWVARPAKPLTNQQEQVAQPQTAGKHFKGKVHFDLLAKLLDDDRKVSGDDWIKELSDPNAEFRIQTKDHPLLGQPAPDFTLVGQGGESLHLQEQLRRGPVVLVFYLGYSCNFCVHDLFELNADIKRFRSLGGQVIAVSGDKPDLTRQRFEQFGAFDFPVLYDPDHLIAKSYGMFRPATASDAEQLLHGTFLIGRDGQVHWVSYGDTPFHNDKALLYELAQLENKLPQPELTLSTGG